jgi:hypothetical protein
MLSATRFLVADGNFSVTKDGTETFCLLALDMRYFNMSVVGLYFHPANLASAVEISFFNSSKSKSPSARVTDLHVSFACTSTDCSKSVICAKMHLFTRCCSTLPRSSSCEILRKALMSGLKELHHSYRLTPGALVCRRMSIDKVLFEKVQRVFGWVQFQFHACCIR